MLKWFLWCPPALCTFHIRMTDSIYSDHTHQNCSLIVRCHSRGSHMSPLNQLESGFFGGDNTLKKSKHICSYNGSQGSPWLTLAVDTAHSPQIRSLISLRRPHLFGNLGLRSRFKMSEGKLWRTRCTTNQDSRGLNTIQHANMRKLWEMHEKYVKNPWQAYLLCNEHGLDSKCCLLLVEHSGSINIRTPMNMSG
jgi:hypothetical protein